MKNRLVVVAIIKDKGKILLGQKSPGKEPYPNTWHIPGGGININEKCEEALVREIKEETCLEIKNIEKVAWDTDIEPDKNGEDTYYIFLQYECNVAGGTLQTGDDIHHLEWVDVKDLKKYKLNKPTKVLFKKLGYL